MSAFKQKLARLGATAGVLAGSTAAMLAFGGVTAGAASAAPACPSNTVKAIEGKGSSLQKVAETEWTGREVPSNTIGAIPHTKLTGPERGYQLACGETPSVSYTSTGSGPGLAAFGFTGSGIVENGKHAGETHTFSFVGSDDAPTSTQIASAESASSTKPLIIPVAETAIAVVVHPPANCTLAGSIGAGLTYAQLTKVFGGKEITTWAGLGATGTGCTEHPAITRVVREEGSGTTFQFKNYLASVVGGAFGGVNMPCELEGESGLTKEWAKMKAVGPGVHPTGEKPNIVWPECEGTTTVLRGAGGGAVVKTVAETSGSIGYAALPDVKSSNNIEGKAQVAWLENATAGTFARPELTTEEKSNCGPRSYEVPAAARKGNTTPNKYEGVDWSTVFGAKPTVGSTLFPLCTLTFNVAWRHYESANYASPEDRAADVKDYILNYVLGAGQSIGKYYQPLPTTTGSEEKNNVQGAAEEAAKLIAK